MPKTSLRPRSRTKLGRYRAQVQSMQQTPDRALRSVADASAPHRPKPRAQGARHAR